LQLHARAADIRAIDDDAAAERGRDDFVIVSGETKYAGTADRHDNARCPGVDAEFLGGAFG
jgi:hypothetical protein